MCIPKRSAAIVGLCILSRAVSPAVADEVLHRYDGDVFPLDPITGWIPANLCDGPCTESLQDGHLVLEWDPFSNTVAYAFRIAEPPDPPPPTLWVEWRFRSDTPHPGFSHTCDGKFRVKYGGMREVVWMFGDAAFSFGGNHSVSGLSINEFHLYRYESLDGINYRIAVDGLVFIEDARDISTGYHDVQFGGQGGCDLALFPTLNEWDHVWFGTISSGEQLIATDPPRGVVDAGDYPGLDRFTVTFDSPNYVYLDEITVEVTGGTAPTVTATRRLDNGEPEVVEIVLDRPLPLNETTRFTFDDGTAVNVVEYTLVNLGACCLPDGSCEVLPDSDCDLAGGTFLDGPCEGDADGDGIDGRCGDPCPLDDPDDTDGDGVCDANDPCPLDNPDDTDNDGICDSVDVCPGFDDTLDTDGDGVRDCQDVCPGADDAVFAPECTVAIPTTTAWGAVVLTLLLLTIAKLEALRRQRMCDRPVARG